MHSKSDNLEIMTYDNPDEIIEEPFELLISRYQVGFKTQMAGSDLMRCVNLLYCKCYKQNFKRGSSYIDSPDWIKIGKTTIIPKNNDDKCFQYATKIVLNYKKFESHPERVSNIKPFTNNYNWEEINYPSKI